MRDLYALPKAHLHLHLEGSARLSTINEFASRTGQTFNLPPSYGVFSVFLEAYERMMTFIEGPDDLARICREIVEDDAKQGALYTEPIMLPSLYSSRFGMSDLEVFDCLREAFLSAGEEFGVEVGFVIAGLYILPIKATEQDAQFAASQSDRGVVGFNLCATEPMDGHARWRRACDIARDAGLMVIAHVGEFGPPSTVRAGIDELAVDRISHGVRAAEDPAVLDLLAESGLVCDIAPTSNVVLGVFPEMRNVPVDVFLERSVPFTLNADDSLFTINGVGDEYVVVRDTFGLSDEQMADIARVSADAANATPATKARIHAGIDEWLMAGA